MLRICCTKSHLLYLSQCFIMLIKFTTFNANHIYYICAAGTLFANLKYICATSNLILEGAFDCILASKRFDKSLH